MLTFLYAIVLLAALIFPLFLLLLLEKKHRQKISNNLLQYFRQKGQQAGLNFSSEEVLHNTVIGVDGIQRKLLFVSQVDEAVFTSTLINLAEVSHCTLEKRHDTLASVKPAEDSSKTLLLKLDLHNGATTEIVFYNPATISSQRYPMLEQKAKQWQTMLQKLLSTTTKAAS